MDVPRWWMVLALVCLLSASCAQASGQVLPRSIAQRAATAATPRPADTSTRSPTPMPTPDADVARGCTPAAPVPYRSAIFTAFAQSGVKPNTPEVALTFDDGPSEATTPLFLDYLERTRTPATFFVIGNQAAQVPDLIQREWRDGFPIGVHTWDHADMTKLSVAQMRSELTRTLRTLHSALGPNACIWLWRPPYGNLNQRVFGVASALSLTTVTWDDDGLDWQRPGVAAIASRILRSVHAGSIVLMHDGPASREQTLDALPRILDGLRTRGLTPVSLPRLLADYGYPGVGGRAATAVSGSMPR